MMLRLDSGKCLRAWNKRSRCDLCEHACPTGALRLKEGPPRIDEARCLACGACAGACPTGALDVGVDRLVYRVSGSGVLVSCRERGEGVVAICIGALKLDHYVILAARSGKVVIDARCEGCPARDPGAVERALRAAGILPGVRVLVGRGPPSPLVRRRSLAIAALKAVALASDVRVSHVSVAGGGPSRAAEAVRLRRAALKASESLSVDYPRPLPSIDPSRCEYCGVCAALCPAGAIEAPGDDSLTVDLDSCVSCGLCAESCPTGAIEVGESTARGRLSVYVEVRQCPVCSYVYPARLGSCPKCESVRRMVLEFHGADGGG